MIKNKLIMVTNTIFLGGSQYGFLRKELCVKYQLSYLNNFSLSSLRFNYINSLNNFTTNDILGNDEEDMESDNKEEKMNYSISWTKDYKHLNKLLSVKGIDSSASIDINKIKYLIFSLASSHNENMYNDIFYSLRLYITDLNDNNEFLRKRLYELIIYNLKKNSSWIKDGGIIDIYYVCSDTNKDNNVEYGFQNNKLLPSITEIINLNNSININQLKVNIYIFSYDKFFREFLDSDFKYLFNAKVNREYNSKLWGFPFLIIEDMNLSTVKYLFKEKFINVHGMSVSWRHKLSPLEENLSNFLYVTDLNESIQTSHLCFSDNVFTSNKLDLELYKNISIIQEFSARKLNFISKELDFILKNNPDLLVNKYEYQNFKIINRYNRKRIKYDNINKTSINPLVLILLKRNHIFELEKKLNDAQGSQKDILKLYMMINLEIENLIKSNENQQNIIDKLNIKINNLNLEISKLEEVIINRRTELNKNKEINKQNKINRKLKISQAKSKTAKKRIRKSLKTANIDESAKLNIKIISDENLLKKMLNENKIIMDDVFKLKNKMSSDQKNIDIEKDKLNNLDTELLINNKKIDNIKNSFKKNSELSVDKDFIKNINVRKNSFNNYDFLSNISKRKYSTLNNGVILEDDRLCYNNNKVDNSDTAINHILNEISTNPMYVKITQILKSSVDSKSGIALSNLDKQLQIEETLRYFWNKELNSIFEGKKSLFSNYVGINLLMSTITKLDKVLILIKDDKRYFLNKKYRNHIILSKSGNIVSIVLSNIIPHMMKNKLNQNVATLFKRIGIELHNNLLQNEWSLYNNYIQKNYSYSIQLNNNYYKIENGLSKIEFYDKFNEILGIISNDDYFKLGCDLSEIISDYSKLFKFINIPMEDSTVQRAIVPGIKLEDQIVKLLSVDSEKLVMVCEPCKWDVSIDERKKFKINKYGGYLLNSINKNQFFIESNRNNAKTTLDDLKIIDCINYLGSVPYAINNKVLYHILNLVNANESGVYSNDKINKNIKLNLHPNTMKLYELNLKKKYGDITDIQKHNSQFYSDKSIIFNALIFSEWTNSNDDNSIYFNYSIDWRGRLYTNSNYLSVQGGNLARSLLMFKKGHILNERGLEHLKIYTANCYGLDKLSYNNRLEWTNNNWSKILSVPNISNNLSLSFDQNAKDFYDFVMKADEPWLFLSCCIELKNYDLYKNTYISKLPVYLDATCSGLQHLSTMINDTNLAKHVNIEKSKKDDIPMDVYSYMISFVENKIQEYIKEDNSLVILDNINITRKFIKPGIMTISYGATSRGIAEQLKINNFKQLDLVKGIKNKYLLTEKEFNKTDSDIHLTAKQIFILGKAIHSVLYEVFPNLTLLVKYLKDMNKLLKILKLPTIWLSPAGLIIEQNYAPVIKRNLETSILGKRKTITISELDKSLTDLRKQNNSIVPNIVHSFDASNISLLVENITSNFTLNKLNLITIHDCFATNANDVDEMILKVKLAFIALYYDKSFIDTYHNFIIEFIQNTGFIIEKVSKPGAEINSYVNTDNGIFVIPTPPSFTINKNLRFNILSSQYFIN